MWLMQFIRNIRRKKELKRRSTYWRRQFSDNSDKMCLTEAQKLETEQFYAPYKKISLVFHNFYKEKTGGYCANFIPDDLYYCYIDPYYNNWEEAKTIDNKCYYSKLFPGIKQPVVLGFRCNGIWFDQNGELTTLDTIVQMIRSEDEVFVKKAVDSEGGKGVFCVKTDRVSVLNVIDKINSDLVIQKKILQHRDLSKLNPSSVNTVRVLSMLRTNEVMIYSVIIRMGINGARVDNASSGGITCGVENDGALKRVAYAANGEKYDYHPTTKVPFSSVRIPNFNKVIELVKCSHPMVPHFRLVSWDIAIDVAGEPVLIEANLKYGELDFHQLNNGPVFGEDTQRILNEVFNNRIDS